MTKITISYHLVASPGAEDKVTLFTVPDGQRLIVNTIHILFPAGVYGELELSFYYGIQRVFPKERVITGDNVLLEFDTKLVYYSGDDVILYYKNTNTTEVREAFIYLTGVLE